jgi:hypothetical protein
MTARSFVDFSARKRSAARSFRAFESGAKLVFIQRRKD